MNSSELKTTIEMALLELDDAGVTALEGAVNQMLEYFTTMSAIDVKNVAPTTHALVTGNRVRPDRTGENSVADDLLEQATDLEDRLIAIPNVL